MSSIIQGYEYDIFISYRQKDNKYDGWVTEFVENLRKELEATFKEEVSVYFDINPHDGLLETYDVNASLIQKLKCLVFIPVISRTYCDLNSYAWKNEFVLFIEQATHDQFGLKVTLPHGNVSNRVLPVRINDLDPDDLKLVEEYLGFIRSVDFIYHSQGVNRPLRQRDDDVVQNTKQLIYRDQINKVANAIDEIIRGLKREQIVPAEKRLPSKELMEGTRKIERRKLTKTKTLSQNKVFHSMPGFLPWLIIGFIFLLSIALGIRWYSSQQKIKWAQMVGISAIQKIVDENFTAPTRAFDMASDLEKIIPRDSNLKELWPKISTTFSLQTQPPGAKVFWKDYNEPDIIWKYIGTTPVQDARVPQGFLRMKFEKEGFQTIYYAGPHIYTDLSKEIFLLKLDSTGTLPENMVRIPSRIADMLVVGLEQYGGKKIGEFLVDKFEVSNKDYKRFVDSGGYSNKAYWNYPIYKYGRELTWNDAVKLFVDKTGKLGPSTWEVGTYPDGKENHPVTGVSWFEAAAYAEFMHKKLPTVYQWSVIAQTDRTKDIVPLSNFTENSTLPLGSTQGITSFGIYDIAGNAREWCLNEGNKPDQRYILGGGFNDPTYSFNCAYTQLSGDRSASNGFRCTMELPTDSAKSEFTGKVDLAFRDYKKEKAVDDKTFKIYLKQFDYDNSPLNEKVTSIEESDIWRVEKVTLDAGYNKERFDIWLCLPKNALPPYQTVIFLHGSGVIFEDVFKISELKFLEFIVKSGRALIFPILKGTYERRDGLKSDLEEETVFYKDHVIMWRKDIGRTIDYLQTRPDLFSDRTGYFGFSWGGFMGGIIPAVEPRIKSIVLLVGGMQMNRSLPEVDQINFLPRVHQPILMLNGKYDMFFPEETSQRPMYEMLGSKIKELKVYNEGHLVPRQDLLKETLKWYDQYLGEVKK